MWIYGFMTGVRSCSKLEAACREQLPYLWLTGWQHPGHNTLWRFYKSHRQSMRKLFKRTVKTALAMDLVDLAVQAVDGTKVAANASRKRSHEAEGLRRLLERVDRTIEYLESRNDSEEDGAVPHLPEELADQETLKERVRQAMDDMASKPPQKHINLTDGDVRLIKSQRGPVPSFDAQAVVSPLKGGGEMAGVLITAADVCGDPDDHAQLIPMMEQTEMMTGAKVALTLADGGYHSGKNLKECAARGRQVLMPDSKKKLLSGAYHPTA